MRALAGLVLFLFVSGGVIAAGEPVGSAFTYQGRLMDAEEPANGLYDFEFRLFDAPADSNQLGNTKAFRGIELVEGYFTIELDFGADVFDGEARWLEIGTRVSGMPDPVTILSPRQELTPTPYAMYSEIAGHAVGGILGGGTEGYLAKFTGADSLGDSGVYDSAGYIGIGTTSPAGPLHLASLDGIELIIEADTNNSGEDQNARIVLSQDGDQVRGRIGYQSGLNKLEVMQEFGDSLILGTSNSDRITITEDGLVGVGTGSPGAVLDVTKTVGAVADYVLDLTTITALEPIILWSRLLFRGTSINASGNLITPSLMLNNESSGNVLMATGGGRVGVNTTEPEAKLDIFSADDMCLKLESTGPYICAAFSVNNPTGGSAIVAGSNSNSSPTVLISSSGDADALYVVGTASVDVLEIRGADVAEKFPVSEKVEPGMVVVIDEEHPGQLCLSRGSYNRCVAGVVSGANELPAGAILGNLPGHEEAVPVALSGRVWVYCDATEEAIKAGDLLTTAEREGHAMAVSDYQRAHGAVIGKAMTCLEKGETGLVLALVNLQ